MELKIEQEQKVHYSIKEVSQLLGINPPTLRFWEKEFKEITPNKNKKGTRYYLKEDIEQIRLVHYLLKVRGMTIVGARQILKDNRDETVHQVEIYNHLDQIRNELLALINALDAYDTPQPLEGK